MDYTEFLGMVSSEFHRYLMENEDFANKIPSKAGRSGLGNTLRR